MITQAERALKVEFDEPMNCRQYSVHPMTGDCHECGKSTNDPVVEEDDDVG